MIYVLGDISVNGETRVQWTISNFFSLSYSEIASPFFSIDGDQWRMYASPKGSKGYNRGWFGLTLRTNTYMGRKKTPFVRLGLAIEDGPDILCVSPRWGHNPEAFEVNNLIQIRELKSRRDEIAPNGNLVIFCSIFIRRQEESGICAEVGKLGIGSGHRKEASTQTEISGIYKVVENYKELLLSGKHSDLTLKVKDKEFNVHRNILGVQSPVFSAMLEHNMIEKATGIANVEDNDPETFLDFLRYLYTGRVENLSSNNALSLYTAADKYQVNELRKECLEYMMDNLSVENFCDIMSLSLRHNETGLTEQAISFFTEKADEIVVTTQWQTFLSENSVAGNELFIKYLGMKKGEKK